MNAVFLLACILTGIGGYGILCHMSGIPGPGETIRSFSGRTRGLLLGTVRKALRSSPERRRHLAVLLHAAGNPESPADYCAGRLRTVLCFLLVGIPAALLLNQPSACIFFFGVGFLKAWSADRKTRRRAEEWRKSLRKECTRFASYLSGALKHGDRDVLGLLERYRKTASRPAFAKELEITVADMRTGSYEEALLSLCARTGLSELVQIVRGLEGVLQGNDEAPYFDRVCRDLENAEEADLSKEAQTRPAKLLKYQFLLMTASLLLMGCALIVSLLTALQQMF